MIQLVVKGTYLVVKDSRKSIITSDNDQPSFTGNQQLKWHVHQNCIVVALRAMKCKYGIPINIIIQIRNQNVLAVQTYITTIQMTM